MTRKQMRSWMWEMVFAVMLLWTFTASAQTYSSGSTGADGAFAPTANTTLTLPPNGVFNFTTINIPSGVTVAFSKNSANTPVTLLAIGDVTIAGVISVNGLDGANSLSSGVIVSSGGAGGPGGFAGGQGGARGTTNNFPSGGQGPGGGNPESPFSGPVYAGKYGAPSSFVNLIPLFGGSGGAGGSGSGTSSGASGGGGGGAIVIVSSTKITLSGLITANGGKGGTPGCIGGGFDAGGGSGGAIRLVAPQITGTGSLQAVGGFGCGFATGESGRIRLEAFAFGFLGTTNPAASTSFVPGPVTASTNPALINLPTLTISSVGGIASPTNPSGSYTTADVALPAGTTNPVPVTLTATNTPVGTIFTVKLIPQFATATTVNTSASTGTFSSSTATASVTFPSGQISLLNAYASFTLPAQVAMLYPLIDGEPVERILLAVNFGEPSIVTWVTRSGKEMKAEDLIKGLE